MNILFLVADKNMEFLLKGLLPRIPYTENIKPFDFRIIIHPERDPGIIKSSNEILRPFFKMYNYSVVILDHSGCGVEKKDRSEIESELEFKLSTTGWDKRCCAISIFPELENWLWVNNHRIKEAISWENPLSIDEWLESNGWKEVSHKKPFHPKEAFEAVLRVSRTPRSSSIYKEISSKAGYRYCQDPAFWKLIETIKKWDKIESSK